MSEVVLITKFISFMPSVSELPPDMRNIKYICAKCSKEITEHFDKPKDCHHVDLCCKCCRHKNCVLRGGGSD